MIKVALDRAAHLMDAVAFGYKDWDGIREELAEVRKYMYIFIWESDTAVSVSIL